MATLLSDYIADVQNLLHDATNKFWSTSELIRYCNKARQLTAAETGCTRQLVPAVTIYPQLSWVKSTAFNLNDRVALQPYNGLYYRCSVAGTSGLTQPTWPTTNGGTVVDGGVTWTAVSGYVYQYPLTNIIFGRTAIACLDVYLWYSGTQRLPLIYKAYSEFSRTGFAAYNMPGMPVIWTQNNQTVYLAQSPSISYTADFDVLMAPADLINLTDNDAEVLAPYNECVSYYMAYLAKLKDQRMQEANNFMQMYINMRNRTLANGIQRRTRGY